MIVHVALMHPGLKSPDERLPDRGEVHIMELPTNILEIGFSASVPSAFCKFLCRNCICSSQVKFLGETLLKNRKYVL
jgi:hypothetical protein